MLLNQIMLYFMTGGTEEEVKEEIKRKIKCGVEIEDVDKEEPQALVIESASSAVNALEVEVLANKCGALKQPDEETPELESISVDQNIETGSRKENNSKDKKKGTKASDPPPKPIGDQTVQAALQFGVLVRFKTKYPGKRIPTSS